MTLVRPAGGADTVFLDRLGIARRARLDRFAQRGQYLPGRITALTDRIADPATINADAYTAQILAEPLTTPAEGPADPTWHVPNNYTDPTGYQAAALPLRRDSMRANAYALRYRLTGDEAAAEAAVAQIEPWTGITGFNPTAGDATRLEWTTQWGGILLAAMAVRDSAAWTPTLEADLAALTETSLPICSTAYTNVNNWGDWGVVFELCSASYLDDRTRFRKAIARWRYLLDYAVDANDDLHQEIYREGGGVGNGVDGLTYSNFGLQAKVYAAEIARVNGTWLYEYESLNGRSLRPVWERIAGWIADPATYPYNSSGSPTTYNTVAMGHFEILHALWPTADSAAVLAAGRPMQDRYSCFYWTVTHAEMSPAG